MQNAFLKHFVFVVVASIYDSLVIMWRWNFVAQAKSMNIFLSKKYICSKVKTTRHSSHSSFYFSSKRRQFSKNIWSVASILLEVYLEFWLTNLWFSFSEKDLLLSACFSFYLAYLFWFNLTISIIFFPTAWIGNWNRYWSTIYSDFLTFWGIQKSDVKTVSIT